MVFQTAFTAPHHKATEVGKQILEQGGTAAEAMVAAASMIAVQYPHMNSIGGDGFWLISKPGEAPVAIDACGAAALSIDPDYYRALGTELPEKVAKRLLPWLVQSPVGKKRWKSMVANCL